MEVIVTADKPIRSLAKHWAGCVIPNYTDLDIMCFAIAIKPLADYYVFGKEVGADGLKHLQFMVCFKTKKTLATVKKLIQTQGHWEVKHAKSTMKRASDYCKKGMLFSAAGLFINWYKWVITADYLGEQSHDEWEKWHETGPNFGLNADFEEFGVLPLDQTVKGREVIAENYEETLKLAREGNLDDICAEHYLKVFFYYIYSFFVALQLII